MIYLDSAATTVLKPPEVARAALRAMRSMGGPGRGSHKAALLAAEKCYECRENAALLLGAKKPENVVFTFNATHGLNIAVRSLVRPGARVLVSGYEHNSVIRPLHALGAKLLVADSELFDPDAFLEKAEGLIPYADAVVCTHVSNAFGYVLPVEGLSRLCKKYSLPFILDASQSAGNMDIDFDGLGADFLACPGHKALMGPQGTGLLLCKNEAKPLLYGGSGSASASAEMPDFLPDMLEAGTHNVCGIAGLNEGISYVLKRGAENIGRHERRLLELFAAILGKNPGCRLFYSPDGSVHSGILSLVPRGMSCEEMGERLDRAGVAVRAGLHCAPLAHKSAGTEDSGTVRFSFSPFISAAQARTAAYAAEKILKVM